LLRASTIVRNQRCACTCIASTCRALAFTARRRSGMTTAAPAGNATRHATFLWLPSKNGWTSELALTIAGTILGCLTHQAADNAAFVTRPSQRIGGRTTERPPVSSSGRISCRRSEFRVYRSPPRRGWTSAAFCSSSLDLSLLSSHARHLHAMHWALGIGHVSTCSSSARKKRRAGCDTANI
jgi:hypothetical protein